MLRDGGAEVGSIARVWSQDFAGQARPDLAAVDQYDVKRVFIEAKFWAGLTKNQPVEYLEELRKHEFPNESQMLCVQCFSNVGRRRGKPKRS